MNHLRQPTVASETARMHQAVELYAQRLLLRGAINFLDAAAQPAVADNDATVRF